MHPPIPGAPWNPAQLAACEQSPSLNDVIHLRATPPPPPPCWGLSPQLLPQRVACIKVATVSSIFLSDSFLFFVFDPTYAGGPGFCLSACE